MREFPVPSTAGTSFDSGQHSLYALGRQTQYPENCVLCGWPFGHTYKTTFLQYGIIQGINSSRPAPDNQ